MARLERRAQGPSVSDGRAEIFDDFAAKFEPASELGEGHAPGSLQREKHPDRTVDRLDHESSLLGSVLRKVSECVLHHSEPCV